MTSNYFLTVSQKVLKAYDKLCEPLLIKYDISLVSFNILMFLTNNPNYTTAQEISDIRHIKKNLVSVHVEKLVNAGFIERSAIVGDRRKIALKCTDKANDIISAGHKMQEQFYQMLTKGIDDNMWVVFDKINQNIEANVEKILND